MNATRCEPQDEKNERQKERWTVISLLCCGTSFERNLGKANRLVVTRINKPDRPNEMNCVRLIAEP